MSNVPLFIDRETGSTSRPGVFAGDDGARGPDCVADRQRTAADLALNLRPAMVENQQRVRATSFDRPACRPFRP